MRFNKRPVRELILPSTAGPDDPAMILGPDVPAELITFYASEIGPLWRGVPIAIQRFQQNENDYLYIAEVVSISGGLFLSIGRVDLDVPIVIQLMAFARSDTGLGLVGIGDQVHNISLIMDKVDILSLAGEPIVMATNMAFSAGAELTIEDGATFAYKGDSFETWTGRVYTPSSDLVKTDTTMQNVPGLSFTIGNGKVYIVECYIALAGPTAANAKFGWSPIELHSMRRHLVGMAAGTNDNRSAQVLMGRRDIGSIGLVGVGTAGGTSTSSYRETGILIARSDSTLNFQFAQATADPAGTTLSAASSFIRVQRVQ